MSRSLWLETEATDNGSVANTPDEELDEMDYYLDDECDVDSEAEREMDARFISMSQPQAVQNVQTQDSATPLSPTTRQRQQRRRQRRITPYTHLSPQAKQARRRRRDPVLDSELDSNSGSDAGTVLPSPQSTTTSPHREERRTQRASRRASPYSRPVQSTPALAGAALQPGSGSGLVQAPVAPVAPVVAAEALQLAVPVDSNVYSLSTLNQLAPNLGDLNYQIETNELCDALDEVFSYWVMQPRPSLTVEMAYTLFGINKHETVVNRKQLGEMLDGALDLVLLLHTRLQRNKVLNPNNDQASVIQNRINRVMGMIKQSMALVENDQLTLSLLDPSQAGDHTYEVWSLSNAQKQAFTPKQELIMFLLQRAFLMRYRKLGGDLYIQIVTDPDENGVVHCTHAWKQEMTIAEFIYNTINKQRTLKMWSHFTNMRGAAAYLEDYLVNAIDRELPLLKRSRYAQSHRNGVYMIAKNQFLEFGKDDIDPNLVSAKYFDSTFPVEMLRQIRENPYNFTFRDVPTPKFDSILNAQKLPRFEDDDDDTLGPADAGPDGTMLHADPTSGCYYKATRFNVCCWFYALLGRLRYEVGARDKWQVILFMKGVAQSGKSTIAQLIKMFFESQDVGILSNNLEKKFGLGSIFDKLVFMCLEVKRDFGVDQGEFQSMVSGEDMSIPVKFKVAESTRWTSPGIMMGNELPDWTNNSGSIGRRVIVGAFNYAVRNANPGLLDELRDELPYIMLKINTAYIHSTRLFGGKDIWSVLPEYFKQQRRLLRADTHMLDHFLQHGSVLLGPQYSTTLENFRTHLKHHAQSNGHSTPKWTADFYRVTFEEYGIENATEIGDNNQPVFMLKGVALAQDYADTAPPVPVSVPVVS